MMQKRKRFTRNRVFWLSFVIVSIIMSVGLEIKAEVATPEEARHVSQNWLAYMVSQNGDWAGEIEPQLMEAQEIVENDTLLGYCFSVSPSGYIVVPILKELPPIKAYSETDRLDAKETEGMAGLLKDVLHHRIRLYAELYGSLDAVQPATGDVLLGRGHSQQWTKLLQSEAQFEADIKHGRVTRLTTVGPLLTSTWHQTGPYNSDCPVGDAACVDCAPPGDPPSPPSSDTVVVGCVATAASQIMRYWNWPPSGTGSHSYAWDGDQTCAQPPGSAGAATLSATFSDAYDWANMLDSYGGGASQAEIDAVAELCYEVAVAFDMDFGVCGSGAWTSDAVTVYPTFFRYNAATIDKEDRDDYATAADWFTIMRDELDNGRPMQYRISRHSIVCDGWQDIGPEDEIHMNYGWGGGANAWYTVDHLYCTWAGCDPMVEYLIRGIQPDNLPPVALCTDVIASADANCQALIASIDNGSYDPEGYPVTIDQIPAGPYPLGGTPCMLVVTDADGLADTCYATVTVVDNTPPQVSCPSDITVGNDVDQCSAVVSFTYSATDNCPGVSVVAAPASGSTFPVGTTPVQVLATDASGNVDICFFNLIVQDTQNPVITCPETIEVEFISPHEAVATFEATATDNCDASPSIVCVPGSGSTFDIGENTVTCTAVDDYGNADTCSFTFHLAYFDIKPRSCPNPLNVKPYSRNDKDSQIYALGEPAEPYELDIDRGRPQGVLPVAILGTDGFDVRRIKPETVLLNGVSPLRWNYEDVATPVKDSEYCACTTEGSDKYMDFTLKFSRDQIVQSLGEVENGEIVPLIVTGLLSDGNQFFGNDCVLIRARRDAGDDDRSQSGSSPISLSNNYPNPFNPITEISFELPAPTHITLEIYNVLGQRVTTLHDGLLEAGEYLIQWDATDETGAQVSSGVYFYRLIAGDLIETKKMLLLK